MSKTALKYIMGLLGASKRDFSVFVSETPKHEKERALRRAADRAIVQQREFVAAFTAV